MYHISVQIAKNDTKLKLDIFFDPNAFAFIHGVSDEKLMRAIAVHYAKNIEHAIGFSHELSPVVHIGCVYKDDHCGENQYQVVRVHGETVDLETMELKEEKLNDVVINIQTRSNTDPVTEEIKATKEVISFYELPEDVYSAICPIGKVEAAVRGEWISKFTTLYRQQMVNCIELASAETTQIKTTRIAEILQSPTPPEINRMEEVKAPKFLTEKSTSIASNTGLVAEMTRRLGLSLEVKNKIQNALDIPGQNHVLFQEAKNDMLNSLFQQDDSLIPQMQKGALSEYFKLNVKSVVAQYKKVKMEIEQAISKQSKEKVAAVYKNSNALMNNFEKIQYANAVVLDQYIHNVIIRGLFLGVASYYKVIWGECKQAEKETIGFNSFRKFVGKGCGLEQKTEHLKGKFGSLIDINDYYELTLSEEKLKKWREMSLDELAEQLNIIFKNIDTSPVGLSSAMIEVGGALETIGAMTEENVLSFIDVERKDQTEQVTYKDTKKVNNAIFSLDRGTFKFEEAIKKYCKYPDIKFLEDLPEEQKISKEDAKQWADSLVSAELKDKLRNIQGELKTLQEKQARCFKAKEILQEIKLKQNEIEKNKLAIYRDRIIVEEACNDARVNQLAIADKEAIVKLCDLVDVSARESNQLMKVCNEMVQKIVEGEPDGTVDDMSLTALNAKLEEIKNHLNASEEYKSKPEVNVANIKIQVSAMALVDEADQMMLEYKAAIRTITLDDFSSKDASLRNIFTAATSTSAIKAIDDQSILLRACQDGIMLQQNRMKDLGVTEDHMAARHLAGIQASLQQKENEQEEENRRLFASAFCHMAVKVLYLYKNDADLNGLFELVERSDDWISDDQKAAELMLLLSAGADELLKAMGNNHKSVKNPLTWIASRAPYNEGLSVYELQKARDIAVSMQCASYHYKQQNKQLSCPRWTKDAWEVAKKERENEVRKATSGAQLAQSFDSDFNGIGDIESQDSAGVPQIQLAAEPSPLRKFWNEHKYWIVGGIALGIAVTVICVFTAGAALPLVGGAGAILAPAAAAAVKLAIDIILLTAVTCVMGAVAGFIMSKCTGCIQSCIRSFFDYGANEPHSPGAEPLLRSGNRRGRRHTHATVGANLACGSLSDVSVNTNGAPQSLPVNTKDGALPSWLQCWTSSPVSSATKSLASNKQGVVNNSKQGATSSSVSTSSLSQFQCQNNVVVEHKPCRRSPKPGLSGSRDG